MQTQNSMKPDGFNTSEGTSHPYITTAHMYGVRNRIEGSVYDTGYRMLVFVAKNSDSAHQNDGEYGIRFVDRNVQVSMKTVRRKI